MAGSGALPDGGPGVPVDDRGDPRPPDQASADGARGRLRARLPRRIPPDACVRPHLADDEAVFAVEHDVDLERRVGAPPPRPLAGSLYVTSERLVHIGRAVVSVDLAEIEQAVLAGGRVLLSLRGGRGVTLASRESRLLRVEIAAARAVHAARLRAAIPGDDRA